jgi:P-type Cu+ transporter
MSTVSQRSTGIHRLAVTGLTCAGCVNAVTRVLSRVPGTTSVRVALETGRAEISGDAVPEALISAIRKAGYNAELLSE